MNLSNWNPFKFIRRKADAKKSEIQKQPTAAPASTSLAASDALQQMMQNFFRDPFFASPALFGASLPENRWFGDFSPTVFHPSMDVVDEGRALRITLELPGMSREDVELTVDDGALTIQGQKRTDASSDEKGCYRTERAYGYFQRVVPLPSNVASDGIEARFEKGVLSVRVPKTQESAQTGRRIEVTAS